MALTFLSEVWSTRMLMDLEAESVFKERGNSNFQRDAVNAKKVHIGKLTTDISVADYTVDTDVTAPAALTDSDTVLNLDKQKYFNFLVDDIAKAQQSPDMMSEALRKAAIAIAQTMDSDVSAEIVSGALAANKSNIAVTSTDNVETKGKALLAVLRGIRTAMSHQNISNTQRPWVVMDPDWMAVLTDYFSQQGAPNAFLPATGEQALRSGFSGQIFGMDIFESNRTPTSGNGTLNHRILAGTNDGFTFADQIASIETYRPELRFADAVKGLYVYGVKVTDPSQLFVRTNTSP